MGVAKSKLGGSCPAGKLDFVPVTSGSSTVMQPQIDGTNLSGVSDSDHTIFATGTASISVGTNTVVLNRVVNAANTVFGANYLCSSSTQPPYAITYDRKWFVAMIGLVGKTIVPTVIGGTPTNYTVSPALPAGLSINSSTGVISGTATTAQTAWTTYTVTATNAYGFATTTIDMKVLQGYTVNSTSDAAASDASPGDDICATAGSFCTLRAAIQESSSTPNRVIYLPAMTVTLGSTITNAGQELTIIGDSSSTSIIDGGSNFKLLEANASVNMNLSEIGLQNGITSISLKGSAITMGANSTLRLQNVVLDNNSATGTARGTIYVPNPATVKAYRTVFSSNDSPESTAICLSSGGSASTLEIVESRFTNNTTTGYGGTIGGASCTGGTGTTVTIDKSTFDTNATSMSGGYGGAIYTAGMTFNISNSTFASNTANTAGYGGAIAIPSGIVNITNSLFTGNSAVTSGHSIHAPAGILGIANTIFNDGANSCTGGATFNSNGNNIINGSSECGVGTHASDRVNLNPLLASASVATHGGFVPVIRLQSSSPAIDSGSDTYCALSGASDARGSSRFVQYLSSSSSPQCDVGPVEMQSGE